MTRRPVRYAVRLLMVAALVAGVVGLGYLWRANSSLASIIADGGGDRGRAGGGGVGNVRNGGGAAFSLGNSGDLFTTLGIGIGVLGLVIVVDKIRRRRRPVRPPMQARAGAAQVPQNVT